MRRFTATLAALLLLAGVTAQAQVFSVSLKSGNKLFFNIVDNAAKTVEIAQPGSMIGLSLGLPKGSLEIPASVTYKDTSYQVVSICEKAFAQAEELTFVSIPSTVKEIGAHAFSGCSSLEGIVFPASEPTIGNAAFEGCKSLKDLSFGSDWKTVNFSLFSDSVAITSVFIPARVVRISGVKLMTSLDQIQVDPLNPAFSSVDGILYSRDGKALYACPCARTGRLAVPEGVERIQEGAFNGCAALTSVTLPSTAHAFTCLDFVQCSSLTELVILSEIPPVTAKWNGAPVFAIRKPCDAFKVRVPAKNYARYQAAVCNKEGEYETMDGKKKETFPQEGFLDKKDILKIKASR